MGAVHKRRPLRPGIRLTRFGIRPGTEAPGGLLLTVPGMKSNEDGHLICLKEGDQVFLLRKG